jgi:hypothetical protein
MEDFGQDAAAQVFSPMVGDGGGPPVGVPEELVAAPLAGLDETQ